MPINVLHKDTPRGRGPEPRQAISEEPKEKLVPEEEKSKEKEKDLAAQETQDLWESQEIGKTSWSGAGGQRYNDPD